MTDKIILELTLDELKLIDKYVELNDETESVFDKIKYAYPQPKMTLQQEGEYAVVSYHDKVYYRLMNETTFSWYKRIVVIPSFPTPTLVMVDDAETERLLEGLYYNHIQVKKEKEQRVKEVVRESKKWCEENPDKDPLDWLKPQTPEQVADGLKEAFRTAIKEGIIPEIKQPTDELIEKLVKKPPEFLKFELGKTLEDICMRWWDDIFTINSSWDSITSIQDFCDRVELWLPKEQSAAGSQDIYAVAAVEGFNDAIKKIKSKLRNKKV